MTMMTASCRALIGVLATVGMASAVGAQAVTPMPANATPIAVGDTLRGALTAESPFHDEAGGIRYAAFRLRAAGRTLRATLRSDAFDAFLEVRKIVPGGTEHVGEDDDGGGNLDSQYSWEADGEYLLIVRHFGEGGVGPFTLSVEEPPPPPIVVRGLVPGLTITERFRAHDRRLPDGRRMHEYALALALGQQVTLALTAEEADVQLVVLHDGVEVTRSAPGRSATMALTAGAAGTYEVRVLAADGAPGTYTVSVTRVP